MIDNDHCCDEHHECCALPDVPCPNAELEEGPPSCGHWVPGAGGIPIITPELGCPTCAAWQAKGR